jgi:outer membrane lipopolysaccharide assembly protein LptE/RlpB
VNDVASRHLATDNKQGLQNLIVDRTILLLNFDGWKCYFSISKPTTDQLNSLPKYILTSELPYTPQNMVVARNLKLKNLDLINKWRAQLGYATYNITSATLNNTTQLVQTVQSETREYMRDYYKTRVWALKPNRLNDVLYSDKFFSSVASIRSYKCF